MSQLRHQWFLQCIWEKNNTNSKQTLPEKWKGILSKWIMCEELTWHQNLDRNTSRKLQTKILPDESCKKLKQKQTEYNNTQNE